MVRKVSGRQILAENIRQRRHSLHWSQEQLAEAAALHRTYIGAIERQERNVSIDNIDRIARAFRIPIATLLTQA